MAGRKVVKFKKRFQPNLAFFIFLLIIIYIIILTYSFFSKKHISIYEVNTSNISDDAPLYGFVMREEEVIRTEETGFVNYYCSEGNRIGKGDVVYTVDANGEVSQMLQQIQSKTDHIDSIVRLREVISTFQTSFSMSNYNDVTRLKFDAKNVVFDMNNGSLYSDLNKMLKTSGKRKDFTKVNAKKSGVIAYTMDGYENIRKEDITRELFDEHGSVARKQMQSDEIVEAGTPVYKLITNNDWSVVVKLDDAYYEALRDKTAVRITVLKDKVSFNASVELFDRGQDHFAKLTTSRYMEHYINDRFLQIEFNLKSASGLKIPNTSILEKEFYLIPRSLVTKGAEGLGVVRQKLSETGKNTHEFVPIRNALLIQDNYYVSGNVSGGDILMDSSSGENYIISNKEKLSGVYYVNKGYCQFKPVEVQYKNKEYSIISEQTLNGLSAYDHIVVDPTSLSEDDFIQ